MCFSAEASLATGAILIPMGAYSVAIAYMKDRTYLALAATPFLFGVQQIVEAGVWFSLGKQNPDLAKPLALRLPLFRYRVLAVLGVLHGRFYRSLAAPKSGCSEGWPRRAWDSASFAIFRAR